MKKIYAILGPTGSGKTNLLYQNLNNSRKKFEVINVDSRQVYQYIPIGTATPKKEILEKIPHHLVSFLEPNQIFSAGEFVKKTNFLIEEIFSRGNIPILCGGTGFYFKAFYSGMFNLEQVSEEEKLKIKKYLNSLSDKEKKELLYKIDPLSFTTKNIEMGKGRFHPNDTYRIQRSLELYFLTNKTLRMHYENFQNQNSKHYEIFGIYLNVNYEELKYKIYQRAKEMIKEGIIEETIHLYQNFGDCNAMKTPGYREIIKLILEKWNHLEINTQQIKEIEDQVLEILYNSHKKYAKSQIKWFRKEKELQWFSEKELEIFLQKLDKRDIMEFIE